MKRVGCGMELHMVKTVRISCRPCILSCEIKFIFTQKLKKSNNTTMGDEISQMLSIMLITTVN